MLALWATFIKMLIFIQNTICDTRSLTAPHQLLDKPNWNNLRPYQDFVCGSGQVIERTKRGLKNWVGENFICKINNGIKYFQKKIVNERYQVKCVGKHQYSNGGFLHKYELVFHIKKLRWQEDHRDWRNNYSFELIQQLINEILESEVRFRNRKYEYLKKAIGKSSREFKEFHLTTTTKNQYLKNHEQLGINLGIPQVFIHLQYFENFHRYPAKVLKANSPRLVPIKLYGYMSAFFGRPYRIWILNETDPDNAYLQNNSRNIRIGCMRIHSEIECLKQILNSMLDLGHLDIVQSYILQNYLNKSLKIVNREKGKIKRESGIDNLSDYIRQLFSSIEPGTLESIVSNIEQQNFRQNIENKILEHLKGITTWNQEAGNKIDTIINKANKLDATMHSSSMKSILLNERQRLISLASQGTQDKINGFDLLVELIEKLETKIENLELDKIKILIGNTDFISLLQDAKSQKLYNSMYIDQIKNIMNLI